MILEGKEYDMEGTDEATRKVLKYVQLKEGTQFYYTPQPILVQEGQSGWAKAKERTSSTMLEGKNLDIEKQVIWITTSLRYTQR